ncbi:diguanylate cyclase [Gallaecimonas kandeliae]|uniref:sensor domain-containing diguanylate cyclase n=1 Tax=Gallaecimonas kandeliae TaxID=3029055 RepID=UPI0026484161|nr:sensor domain-containing diguanylate cyclase [Gallaecimonas kandeliae]WKE64799.1 diguanylate cyclase [Gallaecimonas kandeliae]
MAQRQDKAENQPKSPMKGQVKIIIWLLLAISVIVFLLGYFQAETMNSVRAYVRGEGLWAKAQKDAVLQLYQYSQSGDEAHFQAFQAALKVNLGDSKARQALQLPSPDEAIARQGFLEGGNHPDDVDGLISFFERFQYVYYMARAIDIWTRADQDIKQLQQIGEALHQAHGKGDPSLVAELDRLNHKLNEMEVEFSSVLSDGSRWVKRVTLSVSFVALVLMILTALYISRRIVARLNETEAKLRFSENRLQSLLSSDMLGIFDWDLEGRILDANDVFLDMLGYSRAELQQGRLDWSKLTPEEHQGKDEIARAEIAEMSYCHPFEKEFLHSSGRRVPVYIGGTLFEGHADKGIAFVLDQTVKKQVEEQLRLSATVLEGSRDGIIIADRQQRIMNVNQAYCAMAGVNREDLLGRHAHFFHNGQEHDPQFGAKLAKEGHWQGDTELAQGRGLKLPVRLSISAVRDQGNNIIHYVATYSDISDRIIYEKQLKDMAHYDHLTGLVNRRYYLEQANKALARVQQKGGYCAFFFIDLDNFKPVNDNHGHEVGDKLLTMVARRLQGSVRKSDKIARLGGDEFSVIMEDIKDPANTAFIAEKLIETITQPYQIEGLELRIGCSIGISLYPLHGQTVADLIKAADQAMYKAKAAGKAGFHMEGVS